MRPLSVLQTLWRTDAIRCVLVTHRQPSAYAIQLFDGTRLVHTESVEQLEEAGAVAAKLCGTLIDRPAEV